MSEDPASIQFTYTPADYVEGSRAAGLYFRPSRLRFSWVAHFMFTAVGIIGGPWVILSNPGDRSALLIGSAVLGLGLWYLYGLGVYVWREHFGLRRDFARMEVLQGIREMQFDETTHRTRATHFAYDASWESYKAFVETPTLFVLSQPPGFAMIPKRAFSADQLAAFRQVVNRKLPAAQPQPSGRGFLIALAVGVSILLLLYAALRIFAPKA